MKKLLKLTPLVFTLCFIPIFISAGTFEDGIFSVSGFSKGGLINKHEFDISKTNTSCTSWGNCQSWTKWYCDTNDASACGNQTCYNSAGGIWKRDCTSYKCNSYARDCNKYTEDCTGYTTTYSCPSEYTKINDSYCYSK